MQTNNPAIQQEKIVNAYPFSIGREDCNLNIGGDRRISRRHLELTEAGNQIFVTDLGGKNGSFFGNNRLPAQEPVPLADNKVIRLSSQTYIDVELL
jgi:pSer/pThr/pTyr-binding forkhead associated (FHA) protein